MNSKILFLNLSGSWCGAATSRENIRPRLYLAGVVLLLLASTGLSATNDLAGTLQKGLYEEEANHNLSAAIPLYESLISQFDKDRSLAAAAIFRLGECYRKQGKTNEANSQYERVLREFADESQIAGPSRQNLVALGGKQPVALSPTASAVGRQEQKQIVEKEVKLVEKRISDLRKGEQAGALNPNAIYAAERDLLELKRQLAALASGVQVSDRTSATQQDAADASAEAASLQVKLDTLGKMSSQELRVAVQQEYPNPVLSSLMQKLAESEQALAALNTEFGPNHPKVVQETARQKTISEQIDRQVKSVLNELSAKQKAAAAKAKVLADEP